MITTSLPTALLGAAHIAALALGFVQSFHVSIGALTV